MLNETIETRGHTTDDGTLNVSVNVGIPDVDVAVIVKVSLVRHEELDANGWPNDFFERVAGSMPDLRRGPQGKFEERPPFE